MATVDCRPAAERRDCFPWTENATAEACLARGCLWCDDDDTNDASLHPSCFYDDEVCPSVIDESLRDECPLTAFNRTDCLRNGCIWCANTTNSETRPPCFIDTSVSLGGDFCPDDIPVTERINCHPEEGVTNKAVCLARGCFWCPSTDDPAAPECFAPRQQGYRVIGPVEETPSGGIIVRLERIDTPSWFGANIRNAWVEVEFLTDDRIHIKLTDSDKSRFEPPPLQRLSRKEAPVNALYEVTIITNPNFGLQVARKQTGAIIFDTTIGGLQLSDQFLQIATRLNSHHLFGLGEHMHQSLEHDMNWTRWSMWTRDHPVTANTNLYGLHPFYLNVEDSEGAAHGVLFYNANAQDVSLMPAPALTYRTIGGILDISIFLGPTPEQVIQQYHQAIGLPLLMPYWSLGFHLSRWGYSNLDDMKAAVARMRQYNIPHDVQFADIDYMDGERDFTLDLINFAGLPDFISELHSDGTRFIIILDPGISNESPGNYTPFDEGDLLDIWVKNPDGVTPEEAVVWPGNVYFPDFTNPVAGEWWINQTITFKQTLDYDALWIDMNEPSNFKDGRGRGCNDTQWNYPPFTPSINNEMSMKSLCPDTKQQLGDHYNVHSLYGYSMAFHTLDAARAATGRRSFVLSRSTFPGSGRYAQHWLGDNWSIWSNLRWSIISSLEFNMFGYPFVGADICGFTGSTTEEMCQRWQQLGSFYTFSRNHNAKSFPDQDPGVWPEVARVTRETLAIRYTLLPYLYSLFYGAHTLGGTVVRPLFFEFPNDSRTFTISDQFLWGPAFMISPVLDEGMLTVNVYFPDARWFSYYDGSETNVRGSAVIVDAPLDFIPLYIRGGFILPTQQPDNCTANSRQNPMGLIAGLDDTGNATGFLFWDDGDSQDTIENGNYFTMQYAIVNGILSATHGHTSGTQEQLLFNDVIIMGMNTTISEVMVNGVPHMEWSQDPATQQLTINDLQLIIPNNFTVSWL